MSAQHPTDRTDRRQELTVRARVETLVRRARARGFRVVTAAELEDNREVVHAGPSASERTSYRRHGHKSAGRRTAGRLLERPPEEV